MLGQKLKDAVAGKLIVVPGVEQEKPREGCWESCMLLSTCPLIQLILLFLFRSPGKMPTGIKTNIKSASMHPYQRWAEMKQARGTAVTSIVPAAATTPGLCGAASGHVSWTQVLLCSVRAEDFASDIDPVFFRSGLENNYPFLIQNLKSCMEHSAPCFCLFTCNDFFTPSCWIKILLCTLWDTGVHLLGHKDSDFPLGKATEQLQSKIHRKRWRLSAGAAGLCIKTYYKVSQQGTNISNKHLVRCKTIMTIPQKAKYWESLLQGKTITKPSARRQHFRNRSTELWYSDAVTNPSCIWFYFHILCCCVSYEVS